MRSHCRQDNGLIPDHLWRRAPSLGRASRHALPCSVTTLLNRYAVQYLRRLVSVPFFLPSSVSHPGKVRELKVKTTVKFNIQKDGSCVSVIFKALRRGASINLTDAPMIPYCRPLPLLNHQKIIMRIYFRRFFSLRPSCPHVQSP